jgi:hypothetical protein
MNNLIPISYTFNSGSPMGRIYFLILTSSLIFISGISAQTTFQKTFGNSDNNHANTVILTNTGGYAIAGWYDVEGLFTAEFYLIITDAAGDTLWTRTYGEDVDMTVNLLPNGSGNEGYNLIQTQDNGFLLVGERHDIVGEKSNVFAVKLDENGELLWSRLYGGDDNDYGQAVAETDDGDFVIAGYTESYGTGLRDVYLLKVDSIGGIIWTRTFGGSSLEAASDMQQTPDGGFILAGYTFSYGAGSSDVFVVKTDADGIIEWQKTYGGELNDIGHSIERTEEGGYIIAGETNSFGAGETDIYLIKVDEEGVVEWSKAYGGDNFEAAKSVTQSEDDGYLMAGYSRSFGAGGEDVYLIKTDAQGDTLWTKIIGGTSDESILSVKQSHESGYVMAGYTRSFGAGSSDVYFLKTDIYGNIGCNQSANDTEVNDALTIESPTNVTIDEGALIKVKTTRVGYTNTQPILICDGMVGTDDDITSSAFEIHPNPVNDYLWIASRNNDSFVDKKVIVYDALGKPVQSYEMKQGESGIDVSMIAAGVYLLNMMVGEEWFTTKFVKF